MYLAIGYTLVLSGILLVTRTGNLAAILLVLFVPGYVLVAALFPGQREIDWIERVTLSIGLSIAIVPLLGLALNFTPLGIRFEPIISFIAAFSGGIGVVAYWRRLSIPVADRLSLTVVLGVPNWKEESLVDKALTLALVSSIVIAATTLVYVVTTPRPGERFTAFYILGETGNASNYPTRLNVSEVGNVLIGVENHEFATVNYTTRVDIVGIQLMWNATSQQNDTLETNRTSVATFTFRLADGANWTAPFSFSIPYIGLWKVQFLLYRDDIPSTVYRNLHLWVTVTAPGGS